MRRDPTEFRKRFAAWKDGKKPYEAGLPVYKGGKTPHEEFVEQMGPVLYKELLRTNTPNIDTAYDHMLRLLAYESDYGRSRVARLLHNYGGYGWNGKTYTTFKDDEDFIRHYVLLMNNRYGTAVNADSVQAYGKALKDKGYYEDTLANYTRNLVGMKSLSRSAAAHRLSNPNLYQIKPLALTPAAEQLESAPQFQPVNIVVPEVNTDYSLQNASMQSPAPQAINAWKGKGSPAYGGYSLRMPSIEEYMLTGNIMPRGFKDGKLPGYNKGVVVENNYTNAKFNDDGTFTDDTTRVFDDFYVTPSGVKTKYGSHTDKNWDRYKQQEAFFRTHDQQTGKIKYEPGLEIVSPEFDIISGIRGVVNLTKPIPKQLRKSLQEINNSVDIAKEPYTEVAKRIKTSIDIAKESPNIHDIVRLANEAKIADGNVIARAHSKIRKFLESPAYRKRLEKYYRDKGSSLVTLEYAPGDRIGEQLYNIESAKATIRPRGELIDETGVLKDAYGLYDPNSHSIQIASDAMARQTPEHEMWHAARRARAYLDNAKYKMRVRSLSDLNYYGDISEQEVRVLDTLREMQESGLDINNLTDDQIWNFFYETPIDSHGTNVQSLIDNYWYDDVKNALRNFKSFILPLGFGGIGYGAYNKYAE